MLILKIFGRRASPGAKGIYGHGYARISAMYCLCKNALNAYWRHVFNWKVYGKAKQSMLKACEWIEVEVLGVVIGVAMSVGQ